MENQRILVIGGNGYIGKVLTERLALDKHQVTVFSRKKIPHCERENIVGDLLDLDVLLSTVKNFDLVIDLAGVIRAARKSRYRENVTGLVNLIKAMKHNNVPRLLYFSTQNVHLAKKGPYARSKTECEEILGKAGLDCQIIRPSIVFGVDRNNDFYRLIKIMRRWRTAPIIGAGDNKMMPVLVNDVAAAGAEAVKDWQTGRIIEVHGREIVTMNQVVNFIDQKLKKTAIRIHIPIAVLKALRYFVPFDIDSYDEDRVFDGDETTETDYFFKKLDSLIGLDRENG
jgi:nucleoside-diphosphate-sugar epimerase